MLYQAIVAKKGWRIIDFSDSFMTTFFKVIYFRQTNFLDAKIGSKPTFIWRSILQRVGDSTELYMEIDNGQKILVTGVKG